MPTAVPEPEVVPTAAPAEPDLTRPTDDAMPELDARATPAPAPTPSAGVVSRGGGLRLGGGNDSGGEPSVPSDFQFTYYLQRMLALIESRWYKPPVPPGTSARARFTIQSDGRLQGIVLEQTSRNPSFDRAVLRALYAANPLPPLPPAYTKPTLTIHLTFSDAR
jgi:TonB family protein